MLEALTTTGSDFRSPGRDAVGGSLLATLVHSVVADDGSNPQPIIAKNSVPPCPLGRTVPRECAPAGNRSLVPPDRNRQKLVGIGEALKSLHRNEAIHPLKVFAQPRGQIEIAIL